MLACDDRALTAPGKGSPPEPGRAAAIPTERRSALPGQKKATTRRTVTRRKKKMTPTPEEIATRAYFLHLEDATAGELDNWLRAERELAA